MTGAPDITESLPLRLGGRTTPQSAVYRVDREAFAIAIGDLPFNVYATEEHPYERSSAPWRKDQYDTNRFAGEQTFSEWWLRSQHDFSGGDGITFFEPLEGEGSENRFYDSRGVNVFDYPEVRLLNEQRVVVAGGTDLEFVGIGETTGLFRTGNTFRIIRNGSTLSVTPNGTTPRGIARVPGHGWLIGHSTGISRMNSQGVANPLVTGASAPLTPYWAKDRIFAVQGNKIYQLTLAGGPINESEDLLYEHPTTSWVWSSIAETGAAVWMSGRQGAYSSVYVTTVDNSGTDPVLTSPAVAIQLPAGEYVTKMTSYLDFLLICTNLGFRVAITDGDRAQLGPLLWDEPSFSVTGRGDYAYVGLGGGLVRRVALGITTGTSFDSLQFAWANDAEVPDGGDVVAIGFVEDRLTLAVNDRGCAMQADTLVESGYLSTGFIRFGTLEPKHFASVMLTGDVSNGAVSLAAAVAEDSYSEITSLGEWNGDREVALTLPGVNTPWGKVSLRFRLHRSSDDPTVGPKFDGYQVRALPAPNRRQWLFSIPLQCKDREKDRWGVEVGGPGFAYSRLVDLEAIENAGVPVILQDFRTGEARTVLIEQVHFVNTSSPDRENPNYGGIVSLTVRTVD